MRAALENCRLMEGGPKMAILGMMCELGKSSHKEHQKIVDLLQQCDFDTVWLVGSEFQAIDSPYRKFTDVEEVKAAIAAEQPQGYHILIKGSNSTRLFQLPELL
jgi:UDP-N-acetylmuramoyl-tripeptide--D-alanyl-D-alanine ligase